MKKSGAKRTLERWLADPQVEEFIKLIAETGRAYRFKQVSDVSVKLGKQLSRGGIQPIVQLLLKSPEGDIWGGEMALDEAMGILRQELKKKGKPTTRERRRREKRMKKSTIPPNLLKHPKLGNYLREATSGDQKKASKARRELRALGFKLSDESTWKKFL